MIYKFLYTGLFCMVLSVNSSAQRTRKTSSVIKKPVAGLQNGLDSLSYAMGVSMAGFFKSKGFDKVNPAVMSKAIADIFNNATPTLTVAQADQIIQTKMKSLQDRLQAAAKEKVDAEKERARVFLEANGKRAGVITLSNGLQYEVLSSGDKEGASPKLTDTVVAHYAGTLIDGKEFDNSYKRNAPLRIPVMGVIRGWTEILQLMRKGDKWKVYIPSDLGYGDRGAGGAIPGGAALIFEMELIDINPR
jgi:FKBP-type peptidyl-prolyl cis-trans isomerase FklB